MIALTLLSVSVLWYWSTLSTPLTRAQRISAKDHLSSGGFALALHDERQDTKSTPNRSLNKPLRPLISDSSLNDEERAAISAAISDAIAQLKALERSRAVVLDVPQSEGVVNYAIAIPAPGEDVTSNVVPATVEAAAQFCRPRLRAEAERIIIDSLAEFMSFTFPKTRADTPPPEQPTLWRILLVQIYENANNGGKFEFRMIDTDSDPQSLIATSPKGLLTVRAKSSEYRIASLKLTTAQGRFDHLFSVEGGLDGFTVLPRN